MKKTVQLLQQKTKQQLQLHQHRRAFTTIAEVVCTPYPTSAEIISKSNELASFSDFLCFSDSPLAKPSAPALEYYIQNNIFASLQPISQKLLPVLAVGSRNLQQIESLQDQLTKLHVKNLLLVSGDPPKRSKDSLTSLQVLQQLPTLSKTFDIGVATNCDQTGMNYLDQKLQSGAKYAVCQITFSLQKIEEYLQVYEKRFKGVPLLMGVAPITSHHLLESLHKIKDMYLDTKTFERLNKMSQDELRDEGMKIAMETVHLLRSRYSGTVQGIYVYSKSSEQVQDLITECSKV